MKVVFEKNMTDVEAKFKAALDVIQSLPADGKIKKCYLNFVFCCYVRE